MRQTKVTPGSNLRWESSRMMLPEHVRALNQFKHEQKKKTRPEIDEQQLEYFNYRINESITKQTPVRIIVFGEYEDTEVVGIITRVDQGKLIINCGGIYKSINFIDVLSISSGFVY